MGTILPMRFYERPTRAVARDLLGKALVRRTNGETVRSLITEVEAYDGPSDLASHASRGVTRRTEVMFGPAGRWYVYFIYGMHEMLNIVTGTTGYPAAVLIRGTVDVSGPGRLTRHFKVSRAQNARPASRPSGLWIEDAGIRVPRTQIRTTPRIGVDYAGPVWSKKHYRYVWKRSDPRILRG
ncbi:MAG TPA: DNA-3-methyladenine glycosylase [Candidatus Paceibacterota bacterium]|nr:DNA-3-methyladenine glycosylase [Candidatus Paceibacterota bacterium]